MLIHIFINTGRGRDVCMQQQPGASGPEETPVPSMCHENIYPNYPHGSMWSRVILSRAARPHAGLRRAPVVAPTEVNFSLARVVLRVDENPLILRSRVVPGDSPVIDVNSINKSFIQESLMDFE